MTSRSSHIAGIGMMLLGILLFSLTDATGKWLVATYSVGQVMTIRSGAALAVLAPFVAREGVASLIAGPRPAIQVLRVVCATVELGLFYWCLIYLPLADAMTLVLVAPILVVVISALFLGELVDLRHWLAVAVGFAGVVLALQPSFDVAGLLLPALAALLAALMFALMTVTGRQLRGTPDLTLVVWQNVGALLLGVALLPLGWRTPPPADFALLALLGVVAMLGHMCATRAVKLAPASVVAPFQYMLIVLAIVFGYLVFGDLPSLLALGGACLIAGSGLVLLALERRPRVAALDAKAPGI